MSVLNNITVDGQFRGITTNKGDILANDGTSNNAFQVSPIDSYILSADSTKPFGLAWVPQMSSPGTLTTEITIQPFNFSTNSTTPVVIANTSTTMVSGNILFIGTINCILSKARRYFTIGIYKNSSLISGTQKVFGGIDNVIIPISIHRTITLTGSDIFDVRINMDNCDCDVSIQGINPYSNSSLITSNSRLTINSTTPFEITDLTFSGAKGIIVIIANLNCVLDSRSYFTVGVYKNGVLVNNTDLKFGGIDTLILPVPINYVIEVVTNDIISICINTDSTNSPISVFERTLMYSVYSTSNTLSPQIVLTAPVFATNDTSPIVINGLTKTGISGNFLIIGEFNCYLNIARNYFYVGIYLNNVLVPNTQKKYGGLDNVIMAIPYITMITLLNFDVLEIRVSVFNSSCMLTINERSLFYVQY